MHDGAGWEVGEFTSGERACAMQVSTFFAFWSLRILSTLAQSLLSQMRISHSHSGATVFAWRTLTVMWYSSGSDTGGYSVYLALWRQCEAEE